jgi:hypothetical protein
VIAEELQFCKQELVITIDSFLRETKTKCDNKAVHFFYEIFKSTESGTDVLVKRSKATDTHPFTFEPIKLLHLSNGDMDRNLTIKCYQSDPAEQKNHLIGQCFVTPQSLIDDNAKFPHRLTKDDEVFQGEIQISAKLREFPTFLDYLKGGTQLQCFFAIDFTSKNIQVP